MKNRSGFGWLEFIIGVILIALGVFTFASPGAALTGFAVAYGVIAVVMGVADIVLYVRAERYTGFGPIVALVAGILSVMSGMVLLVYPSAATIALTFLFPLWFIAHCISKLSQINYVRYTAGDAMYYITLIINVIGLVLGFMMLLSPVFTLSAIRYFACIYLVLLGVDSIMTAFSRMGMPR